MSETIKRTGRLTHEGHDGSDSGHAVMPGKLNKTGMQNVRSVTFVIWHNAIESLSP